VQVAGDKNCSPWLREQAGEFYDAGIKKTRSQAH
jgi:hypothetical protein